MEKESLVALDKLEKKTSDWRKITKCKKGFSLYILLMYLFGGTGSQLQHVESSSPTSDGT